MKKLHYINLTDGIEWLGEIENPRFVRVESTAIEKNDWTRILRDLDADLLMNLAIGNVCHFYDCGTRREVSKTVYLGVPKIVEMLSRYWIDKENIRADTETERQMKRKIIYFQRFLDTDEIRLVGHSKRTDNDGNRQYFRKVLLAHE